MPNNPISGLGTLTAYSTADLVEAVDVSDTTYSATGTNKKVTFQNLLNMAPFVASGSSHIGGAVPDPGATAGTARFLREDATWTTAGSPPGGSAGQVQYNSAGAFAGVPSVAAGNVLTDNGSGVSPTFQVPVTSNYVSSILSSTYNVTTTLANIGLSITLTAGTWLITASIRCNILISGPLNSSIYYQIQLYDTTNSVQVPNALMLPFFFALQVASTSVRSQATYPVGPFAYTVSGSTAIQVRASYTINGGPTVTQAYVASNDGIGNTLVTAVRIA
jgi:hypothetical protein